jgi:sigma-E factor negative regulatory protein RseA
MNEKLSALMDGELDRDSAESVIKSIGADSAQRAHWDCYHLIGDALRGDMDESGLSASTSTQAIFSRLALEPTVLAPSAIPAHGAVHHRTRIALAMAASVITVSAIVVIAFKQQAGIAPSVQLVQQVAPQPVVSAQSPTQVNTLVNDYLAVHRQFANPSSLQAASLRNIEPRQASGQ